MRLLGLNSFTRTLYPILIGFALAALLWGIGAATGLGTGIAGAQPAPAHQASGQGYVRPAPKVPRILRFISGCESGHNSPYSKPNYRAQNPHSTASGAYQFLDSTWAGRFGVRRAMYATKAQQDQAAIDEHRRNGTTPWAASRHCWAKAL